MNKTAALTMAKTTGQTAISWPVFNPDKKTKIKIAIKSWNSRIPMLILPYKLFTSFFSERSFITIIVLENANAAPIYVDSR